MRRYWSSTTARSAAVFPEGRLRVAGRGSLTTLPTVPRGFSPLCRREEVPAERLTADGEGVPAGQRTPRTLPAARPSWASPHATGHAGPPRQPAHDRRTMTGIRTMPRMAQRTPGAARDASWTRLAGAFHAACALRPVPDTLRLSSARSSSALPSSGRHRGCARR